MATANTMLLPLVRTSILSPHYITSRLRRRNNRSATTWNEPVRREPYSFCRRLS
jgi:hypothetical protein